MLAVSTVDSQGSAPIDATQVNATQASLLKFFFAALLDEETLRRFVDIHRAAHEQYLAYFRDLLPKIVRSDPAPAHVLRFAMVFEESLLAWLDSIPWGRLAAEDLD